MRARQTVGKYRIKRKIARGGFGDVYEALDTVEGLPVALKIPRASLDEDALEDFRKEIRLNARLNHPNILPIKNADVVQGRLIIAYPLGERSLDARLRTRISFDKGLDFAEQILKALAHAHSRHVIHCDVKPENLILFPGSKLRLGDFGIARVAMRTVHASGSGSIGYIAPEQAMGRPSARSDVFCAGLLIYRILTGALPVWPFEWPPPRADRLRKRSRELLVVLRRAMRLEPRRRYRDAGHMLDAFRAARAKTQRRPARRRKVSKSSSNDWQQVRVRQFRKAFGKSFELRNECGHCGYPIDERMRHCPWCGTARRNRSAQTSFPAECPRCRRGVKLDWKFCPWCYGAAIGPVSDRTYADRRYTARCGNRKCGRKQLMPFMRYCPWCRAKNRRPTRLAGTRGRCDRCGEGCAVEFWSFCGWCGKELADG